MAVVARLVLVCSLVAPWALPTTAAANPAVQACQGKAEGDPCGVMQLVKPEGGGELQRKTIPGACRADECCDLDYSKGSPPATVCHACLACKEGPADVAPPSDDGKATPPASGEPPRTDEPPAPGPAEQRGCSVTAAPTSAAWTLGLLALVLVRRRD